MSQKTIKETKLLWSKACKEAGVSWLVFDKALWLLGSEGRPKTREDVLKLISQKPYGVTKSQTSPNPIPIT